MLVEPEIIELVLRLRETFCVSPSRPFGLSLEMLKFHKFEHLHLRLAFKAY